MAREPSRKNRDEKQKDRGQSRKTVPRKNKESKEEKNMKSLKKVSMNDGVRQKARKRRKEQPKVLMGIALALLGITAIHQGHAATAAAEQAQDAQQEGYGPVPTPIPPFGKGSVQISATGFAEIAPVQAGAPSVFQAWPKVFFAVHNAGNFYVKATCTPNIRIRIYQQQTLGPTTQDAQITIPFVATGCMPPGTNEIINTVPQNPVTSATAGYAAYVADDVEVPATGTQCTIDYHNTSDSTCQAVAEQTEVLKVAIPPLQ